MMSSLFGEKPEGMSGEEWNIRCAIGAHNAARNAMWDLKNKGDGFADALDNLGLFYNYCHSLLKAEMETRKTETA